MKIAIEFELTPEELRTLAAIPLLKDSRLSEALQIKIVELLATEKAGAK